MSRWLSVGLVLVLGWCAGEDVPDWVRAQDEPEWVRAEGKCLRNVRQLTHHFERAGEAYFSPDMRYIVFQAEEKGENPFYQIYVMELASGRTWRVSPGVGRTTCAYFHPSGEKLIFASTHLDPDARKKQQEELARRAQEAREGKVRRYEWVFDPHFDIFECRLDGTGLRRLTDSPGYDAEGSYSPDGKHIVFCSARDGNLELYIMDSEGKHVRRLTRAPGCYNGGPFFSPDGKRVVFRADRKKKDYLQIYVINADGTGEEQLTDTVGVNWGPYWHPDGRHIVYSAADHSNPAVRPNYDLWLMEVATRKKVRITYAPGADVLPVFSPDGKKLMWTSTRDGKMPGAQIFLADFVMPEASEFQP
ncbi:MAG: biopolymer transporter Tol [Gemmatales bacterium]|nr:biopolymer transporter Tol [Gemmatales bacterium]